VLTRTLSNGQEALGGNWTNSNTFSWDGKTWALDNGTEFSRFTATLDQKNKGVIRGTYRMGADSGDFTMFFNSETGEITTFTDETWTFQSAPPEGMVLEPWILEDTAGGNVKGVCVDGPLTVGAAGLSLAKRAVPEGTYGVTFKLRDLTGTVTSSRSVQVVVEE
jgi:hypothetical protein